MHHVTTRGAGRQDIFLDYRDRVAFLLKLATVVNRHGWRCHAYCLMGNHHHLLVETREANLGEGMRLLNGDHARAFNRRHRRNGHLFGERFHAELIERESHLLETARYVVLNPVRAGLCRLPWEWPWSSFVATAGGNRPPPFLTVGGSARNSRARTPTGSSFSPVSTPDRSSSERPDQNRPTVRPDASMSTFCKAGVAPRPGIVCMSPQRATSQPAPV
jgi:REP element-mobilizing transposase RayT